jgi:hypothetical protein
MTCVKIGQGIMDVQPDFKPGDLPPEGYHAWHEWAEVQRKAGIKQVECCHCGLWKTPQELSEKSHTHEAFDKRGRPVTLTLPVCLKCAGAQNEQE